MPISLQCSCGRDLRLREELAGKKIRCPACQSVLAVPEMLEEVEEEPVPDVLPADDDETTPRPERRSAIQAEPPERRRSSDNESLTDAPLSGWSTGPIRRSPDAPRRRRRRPELRREGGRGLSAPSFEINGTLAGGIIMMIIAVLWFVLGLKAGFICFFPPVLFVVGLIAVIRGLSGG
jgi:hypothetical protein